MKKTSALKTVPDYIERFPKEVQSLLKQLRTAIKKAAPKAEEKISYGMPGYKQDGVLVYFAATKSHIGFYAMTSAVKKFSKELEKYDCSAVTIRFPLDQKIPVKLVEKIVKFRVKENIAKQKAKAKSKIKIFSK